MMCKLKLRMDEGGHYDVEMKEWMQKGGHYYVNEGIMMCKLKVDAKSGIKMCKLKGRLHKGHYDVQTMRWMQKVAL